jgi:hypothetical protein
MSSTTHLLKTFYMYLLRLNENETRYFLSIRNTFLGQCHHAVFFLFFRESFELEFEHNVD